MHTPVQSVSWPFPKPGPRLEIPSLPNRFEISGSRSQNGPYKQMRKVKIHFTLYQTFTSEPLNLPC
ncbi:unnamed protein product [Staurois parvus]|uniref:Uncharacterized protein n=1 Tax=Staurois parvus TaxID=386267 RepID=A0ABN9AQ62_9NEOB|nr:unnamed protein product [Staurois parvus]